jgi:hypothetical protein
MSLKEDLEMLKEAEAIRQDAFLLILDMDYAIRDARHSKISYRQQENLKKMMAQLEKDYVFIDNFINKMNKEII